MKSHQEDEEAHLLQGAAEKPNSFVGLAHTLETASGLNSKSGASFSATPALQSNQLLRPMNMQPQRFQQQDRAEEANHPSG